eukprot:m.389744 g.389744  ORF g.389744 m.389744 type:complete len:255 (+) comp21052_c0_seq34:311-1075(+)
MKAQRTRENTHGSECISAPVTTFVFVSSFPQFPQHIKSNCIACSENLLPTFPQKVRPIFEFPDVDWVFVTPEPRHEVALKCWAPGTCGRSLGYCDTRHFRGMYLDRLGRDTWKLKERSSQNSTHDDSANGSPSLGRISWQFSGPSGRMLQVFINSTVEDLTSAAVEAVRDAQVLYVKGYCPDPAVVRQLCPHLETLHCPEHLESACMQYGIKNVNLVLEGDWKPVDGDDFDAKTPRDWIWEAIPTGSDSDEYME